MKKNNERIILFSEIIYPKNFKEKLNKFNHKDSAMQFFIDNRELVYAVAILHKKDDDEINELIEEHRKDCFGISMGGGTVFFDDPIIVKNILDIKRKIEGGIPIRHYNHWFIANACLFHENATYNPSLNEEKEMYHPSATACELSYDDVPNEIVTLSFCSSHGSLLKEPALGEMVTISQKIIKDKLNGLGKRKKKIRDPIEHRLRHEVFKRNEYKCVECGKGKKETTLHVDHIIPVTRGGSDELDNLQTLCEACNLAKSDKIWDMKKENDTNTT